MDLPKIAENGLQLLENLGFEHQMLQLSIKPERNPVLKPIDCINQTPISTIFSYLYRSRQGFNNFSINPRLDVGLDFSAYFGDVVAEEELSEGEGFMEGLD